MARPLRSVVAGPGLVSALTPRLPDATDRAEMGQQPPLQPDQEWANALTHGVAAIAAAAGTVVLASDAFQVGTALGIACAVYGLSVCGTFAASTLSHAIHRQPWLDLFRSWDQGMIYAMISGTYTPFVIGYAPTETRALILAAIWVAAIAGFAHKVVVRHRINASGTVSYLLLGWLPAMPLISYVPLEVGRAMAVGGVLYSLGVVFLVNDARIRYFHALWHLCVMFAATVHFAAIWFLVVGRS